MGAVGIAPSVLVLACGSAAFTASALVPCWQCDRMQELLRGIVQLHLAAFQTGAAGYWMPESNSRGTFGLAFLIGVQVLLSQHQQLPSFEGTSME